MLIEQMIDFVEELPTEWQQQREQIQQKFGSAQEPVTSMLLLNAYKSFTSQIIHPAGNHQFRFSLPFASIRIFLTWPYFLREGPILALETEKQI